MLLNRCLEKSYPKDLPNIGVVLIYLNEALSVIKRAMRSIINRTPKHLLKEIILVDDNSSNGWLVGHKRLCNNSYEQNVMLYLQETMAMYVFSSVDGHD